MYSLSTCNIAENKTFNSPTFYFIKITQVPELCILSDDESYRDLLFTLGKSDEMDISHTDHAYLYAFIFIISELFFVKFSHLFIDLIVNKLLYLGI